MSAWGAAAFVLDRVLLRLGLPPVDRRTYPTKVVAIQRKVKRLLGPPKTFGDPVVIEAKPTKKPRKRSGQKAEPPCRRSQLRKTGEGTKHHRLLVLMDGEHTIEEITSLVDPKYGALHAAHCMHRDVGVGYRYDRSRILRAWYPRGASLKDVVAKKGSKRI